MNIAEENRLQQSQSDRLRSDISVVICAYTEERWEALGDAIESAQAQWPPPLETIVVVDHNASLRAQVQERYPDVIVLDNCGMRGLSAARNTGVAAAGGGIVAFLDDDAAAEAGWLTRLADAFREPGIVGAGGRTLPCWEVKRPAWLPEEFLWTVGCSYRGQPENRSPTRNPIGANMAFRREALLSEPFRDGIGRVGAIPLGCEETEVSIRIRARTGGCILYLPDCRVQHRVTAARVSLRYFLRRCWAEGVSKALIGELVGRDAALESERAYVLRTLPSGVLRGLLHGAHGDWTGFQRAGAIVGGLAVTSAGYLTGRLRWPTRPG